MQMIIVSEIFLLFFSFSFLFNLGYNCFERREITWGDVRACVACARTKVFSEHGKNMGHLASHMRQRQRETGFLTHATFCFS